MIAGHRLPPGIDRAGGTGRSLGQELLAPEWPAGPRPWSAAVREIIFAVEEAPEGGYVARALGAAIFTEADDLEALREAVRDAVRCHFDEIDRPKVIRLHLVREEVLAA